MFKQFIVAVCLFTAAFSARAERNYTDVYYNPAESGWGVFLVQTNTFQFVAFFIYGSDGRPTWYSAQLTDDGTGNYTGSLYATTGTYFALPWNSAQATINPVGTVKFSPVDIYRATITYTVNGVGTVSKAIQRTTLTPEVLGGSYSGSLTGSISGCANPANNVVHFDGRFNLNVSQVGNQSATLTFTIVAFNGAPSNAVCTLSGPIAQVGLLYQMANASYSCPLSPATSAIINSFHVVGQGIEGRWHADDGGGCVESVHFSAVDLSLN